MKVRSIHISYGQIAVFRSALRQPLNHWTASHVAQGFAWRSGSVSFATLEPAGPMSVELDQTVPAIHASTAARVIAVPFTVDETGEIEVASISDSEALLLPPGEYRLTFEHGLSEDNAMWCRLFFEAVARPVKSEILRADPALLPPSPLIMDAVPAE